MAAMNPSNQQASTVVPLRAAMSPMLLALACSGSRKELEEACLREPSLLEGVSVEGDTALHAVTSYGDSANFLKSADFIFGKAKDLLFVQNNNKDTPLHCAARAGNPHMIYRLIGFAKSVGRAKEFLEMENKLGETALHEAVRIQNNGIVEQLMEEDPELASIPRDGTSPLYLAVLFGDKIIAETLHAKSAAGMLSYSGPKGQNALHAGVLRGKVMTEMLLNWKKDLAKQADQMGSTPLHIAAALTGAGGAYRWTFSRTFPWVFQKWHSGVPIKPLVHADPYQLYQPDREGLFPIHVAAASGLYGTTNTMITEYPEIAGQRDSKGRTFIHVAAELKRGYFVENACCTPLLEWILNMRDKDGNTALHLAVQLGDLDSFCYLLMNKKVHLDLTNNNGETPLDISRSKLPTGYSYGWNAAHLIDDALILSQARHGYHLRYDQLSAQRFHENKPEDEVNESNKLTNSTQAMLIGSVLIATVTFGASFTVPGGYNNGGTPTLSGRYIFDAFMMANTIAFLLSAAATINLMYAGMVMVDLRIRRLHFNIATYCAFCAVTSLGAAFALGAYLTLASAAHMTAIAICALVFLISWFGYTEPIRGIAIGRALHVRMGSKAFLVFARIISMRTLGIYWPLVVIFGSAAISTKYGHKQMT